MGRKLRSSLQAVGITTKTPHSEDCAGHSSCLEGATLGCVLGNQPRSILGIARSEIVSLAHPSIPNTVLAKVHATLKHGRAIGYVETAKSKI
jgi:hypothetical protein